MTTIVVDFNHPEQFPATFAAFKKYLEETSGQIVKKIQFKDDEGDYVTITSDLEYTEAFKAATTQGNLDLQILVESKPEAPKVIQHEATCDVCQQQIRGIRYKCSNCPDYDLCEACEALNLEKSLHDPDHLFLKIYRPISPGMRNTLPILYSKPEQKVERRVEEHVEEQKIERNHPQPRVDLEARLSKIEGDLKKIQRLMSNKDKLKKEKPVSRREKRFGINKRKVEAQDQFVKIQKEEKEKEITKEEVKPESQPELELKQLMKQFEPEPEIELKKSEPEIEIKQPEPEPEIELKQPEPEIELKQPEPEPEIKQSESLFHAWEEQMLLLQAMGFLDLKLNLELLERYQDINRVVEELI
jgi:hypothetical protein